MVVEVLLLIQISLWNSKYLVHSLLTVFKQVFLWVQLYSNNYRPVWNRYLRSSNGNFLFRTKHVRFLWRILMQRV